MINRKLTNTGIHEFSKFIEHLRSGDTGNTPYYLLRDNETSEPLSYSIDVEDIEFESRYEFGVYLVEKLNAIERHVLYSDDNLWTTLGLFWFDKLCPVKKDGSRKPAMVYNYVLSRDYRHRPRHAAFTTWMLVELYGEDAMFLLSRGMPVRGELIEQIMGRQNYVSRKGVIQAASKLYTDPEKKTFKKGSTSRSTPGCVARFIAWLNQIDLNYDLFEMSSDQIIKIMPKEFDRFIENTS